MGMCAGCTESSLNGENPLLTKVRCEAKKYATENAVTVAIYTEAGGYNFAEYGHAVSEGLAITEVVSKH